jgi:hypothetical protein
MNLAVLADKSERRQAIDVMSDTARHILVFAVLHGQGRHYRQRLLRQRLDAQLPHDPALPPADIWSGLGHHARENFGLLRR